MLNNLIKYFVRKIFLALCLAFFFSGSSLFSQALSEEPEVEDFFDDENDEGDQIASNEDENLKSEDKESEENKKPYDEKYQSNFVFVINKGNFDLNPHTASYSVEAQMLTGLYEGLFTYNPVTCEPEKALASSFRISRDKKRWTFEIREGAKFSDGKAIDAEVVRNSWLSLIENPRATYSSLLDIIEGAQEYRLGNGRREDVGIYALDEKTLSVRLKSPEAQFSRVLCMPCFSAVRPDEKVYSGPFVLESRTDDKMIFVRNENYYDRGKVPLEKITIILSDDAEENAYLMNMGLANWVDAPVNVDKLLIKDCAHVSAQYGTEFLFFKNKEGSIWNNADFRCALLEAIPWDKMRESVFVKAETFVYPLNGYPKVNGYTTRDEMEASFLMKEARKAKGISPDEKLKLRFLVDGSERIKKFAEILKEAWEPLGVELVTEKTVGWGYNSNIDSSDADLFYYCWIGDYADPLTFLELFRTGSSLNCSNWSNKEYDELLEKSALYTDENHFKYQSQAEQVLLDSGEIITTIHPVSMNAIDLNGTGGWYMNAFDMHPFKYIFLKPVKSNIKDVVLAK